MIVNHETALKTLRRMTHEILEKNDDVANIVLVGILKKGLPIARLIRDNKYCSSDNCPDRLIYFKKQVI